MNLEIAHRIEVVQDPDLVEEYESQAKVVIHIAGFHKPGWRPDKETLRRIRNAIDKYLKKCGNCGNC